MKARNAINYLMISAVRENRIEIVEVLINSFGLSWSQAWAGGYVLLRDAIEKGYREIAKLLLAHGSKVDSKNKKPSNTALHYAVINGDTEIVKMLLDRGANVSAKNSYHSTPLHFAVESEYIDIIKLLLSKKIKVNAKEKGGMTPLHIAANQGNLQIVEHLLNHCADINFAYTCTSGKRYTSLGLAVEKGHETVVKLLLDRGAKINLKMALSIAIKQRHGKVVKLLLQNGANIMIICDGPDKDLVIRCC